MTRKGYTLIEILVVITIIVVLLSITYTGTKNYYALKNEIEVKNFNDCILNMFNYARFNCKNKECAGQMRIFEGEDKIKFYEGVNLKSSLPVPSGFRITKNDVTSTDRLICFDRNGLISNACSIEYKDRLGKTHVITIGVGSFYVDIKE